MTLGETSPMSEFAESRRETSDSRGMLNAGNVDSSGTFFMTEADVEDRRRRGLVGMLTSSALGPRDEDVERRRRLVGMLTFSALVVPRRNERAFFFLCLSFCGFTLPFTSTRPTKSTGDNDVALPVVAILSYCHSTMALSIARVTGSSCADGAIAQAHRDQRFASALRQHQGKPILIAW
eukprot:6183763-Prymnesium_polylepis.4